MRYSRYHRTQLDQDDRPIYDALVDAMEKMVPEITLPSPKVDNIQRILDALNMDNPHLFYVDFYQTDIRYNAFRAKAKMHYRYTSAEVQSLQRRISREVAPIIQSCKGKQGKALAQCIHDWLVLRGTYGTDEKRPEDAHTIEGMLLYKKCVCEGYAKAFQYLADHTGLLSLVAFGDAEHPDGTGGGHAWNIVRINKICYQIDTTFDCIIGSPYISRAYFCLSTKEISRDHRFTGNFTYPDCPAYGGDLQLVGGTRALMDFLAQERKKGVTYSEVRLTTGFSDNELLEKVKNRLELKDWGWYNKIDKWWYGEQQRSVFITWK